MWVWKTVKSPEYNPVLSHLHIALANSPWEVRTLWTWVFTFPHLDVKPASNEFPLCATEDKQEKLWDVDSDT